jgi:hypothetical protein
MIGDAALRETGILNRITASFSVRSEAAWNMQKSPAIMKPRQLN